MMKTIMRIATGSSFDNIGIIIYSTYSTSLTTIYILLNQRSEAFRIENSF